MEEKFKEIFEKSPIGILFLDKEGEITDANPSTLEIMGYSSLNDIIGLNMFNDPYIAPKKDELLEKGNIKIQSLINFDNIKKSGIYNPTRSGTAFLDLTISVINSGFLAQIQDITKRKKAEEAVVFQAHLLAQTGEAILSSDANYNINYWNKAAEKTFGWKKEEVLGKNSGELLKTKIEGSSRTQEVSKMWKEGHWKGEAQYLRKDGKYFITNVTAKVLKDANGKDAGIVTVVRDITKHKKAEEELKESEEKFSKVFYANPGAIAILKPEGPILEVNDEFINLTGYNKDELIGRSSVDLNLVRAGFREKVYKKMQEKGPCHNLELEIQTKSCEKRTVLNTIENIEIKGQKRILSIFFDITRRKKAEEELKEAHDMLEEKVEERTVELEEANITLKDNELRLKDLIYKLERSNRELRSFAYITSHDLQEPLRTVASFTQLLQRRYEGKFDSDADEFMDYIVEASKRMKSMIQGLLEYSRIDREIEFVETDMNVKVEKAISNLHTAIEESNAEITHDNLPTIIADPDQMVRVFQNFISNAIKFKKPQLPPRIHISSKLDEKNKEYVFSVEDNGIGMDPQYTSKIFEIFRRLHTINEYEGTGIGLAIIKRIIERHGGRVWVKSELGMGSTFYFTIPLSKLQNKGIA